MSLAARSHENSRAIQARPLSPILLSDVRDIDIALSKTTARGSTPWSIHQPQSSLSSLLHGAPLVEITGVPAASASATVSPKFSFSVGRTKTLALRYASHFA